MNIGSFESVQWNACVHRLDLCLHSHLKVFGANGVRVYHNSEGKIPSTDSSVEDWTHDTASCITASPTHYRLSYAGLLCLKDKIFYSQSPARTLRILVRFCMIGTYRQKLSHSSFSYKRPLRVKVQSAADNDKKGGQLEHTHPELSGIPASLSAKSHAHTHPSTSNNI